MKTRLFYIWILSVMIMSGFIISSCNKDDKEDKISEDNLIGTWKTNSASVSIMVGSKSLMSFLIEDYGYSQEDAQLWVDAITNPVSQQFTGNTITLKNDYTYTAVMGGNQEFGDWHFSSADKKLIIYPSSENSMVFDVIEVSSKKMVLKIIGAERVDLNENGFKDVLIITVTLDLSKQ